MVREVEVNEFNCGSDPIDDYQTKGLQRNSTLYTVP